MPRSSAGAVVLVLLLISLTQFASAGLIHAKAWLAPILIERAWQQSLLGQGRAVKPWPWADTWPVARLSVPALGVTRFVLHGDGGHSLAFGPGYDISSAAFGDPGTAIVGGHRDTHFAFLADMATGVLLTLQMSDGHTRQYRVARTQVVDSQNGLLPVSGSEELVLVTCFPFDGVTTAGSLRFLVHLDPVPAADGDLSGRA